MLRLITGSIDLDASNNVGHLTLAAARPALSSVACVTKLEQVYSFDADLNVTVD